MTDFVHRVGIWFDKPMRIRGIVGMSVSVVAVAAVAGCGGSSSGQNTEQCEQFSASYDRLAAVISAGPTEGADAWDAAKKAEFDTIRGLADSATDPVSAPLNTLIEALPDDPLQLSEADSESGQALVNNAEAVSSACAEDGTTITLADFPLITFQQ